MHQNTHPVDFTKLMRLLTPVMILVLGFALRLNIYDHGLPFVESPDEAGLYVYGNYWRGTISSHYLVDYMAGYPPAYPWLIAEIMNLADRVAPLDTQLNMGIYVRVLRASSLLADLFTLALLMRVAAAIGGGLRAAALTGAVYAVSAPIAFIGITMLTDVFTMLFSVLCLLLSIYAWQRHNTITAFAATLARLVAVLFKYTAFPFLLLPAAYYMRLLWRRRARALLPSFAALVVVLTTACWLLFIYGAANLQVREAVRARTLFFSNLLTPQSWSTALLQLLEITGIVLPLVLLVCLPLAKKRWGVFRHRGVLVGLSVLAVVNFVTTVGYIKYSKDIPARYVLPTLLLLLPLCGLLIENSLVSFPRARWAALLLPVLFLLPAQIAQLTDLNRPDARLLTQYWVEQNLPNHANLWIADYQAWRLFWSIEGGYPGLKRFTAGFAPDMLGWMGRGEGFDYLIISAEGIAAWPLNPAWPRLDELILLKHVGDASTRGPDVYIYRLTAITPVNYVLRDGTTTLALRGLAVTRDAQQLVIDSLWQAPGGRPTLDYSYFLHLSSIDAPDVIIAQQDAGLGLRRTSTWDDALEWVPGSLRTVSLTGLPPGDYLLTLGVYYWETGQRLALPDGQTTIVLTQFTIP